MGDRFRPQGVTISFKGEGEVGGGELMIKEIDSGEMVDVTTGNMFLIQIFF